MNKNILSKLPIIGICLILALSVCVILYKRLYKHKEGLYDDFRIRVIIKDAEGEYTDTAQYINSHSFDKSNEKDKEGEYLAGSHPTHYLRKGDMYATVKDLPLHVDNNYYIPENCKMAFIVVKLSADNSHYEIVEDELNDSPSGNNMLMCYMANTNYKIKGHKWKGDTSTIDKAEDVASGTEKNKCIIDVSSNELNAAILKKNTAVTLAKTKDKLNDDIKKLTDAAKDHNGALTAAEDKQKTTEDVANKLTVKFESIKAAQDVAQDTSDDDIIRLFVNKLNASIKLNTPCPDPLDPDTGFCGGTVSANNKISDILKLSTYTDTEKPKFDRFFKKYHTTPMNALDDVIVWIKEQQLITDAQMTTKEDEYNSKLDIANQATATETGKVKDAEAKAAANEEELRKKNNDLRQNQTLTKQYNVLKRAVSQSCPTAAGQGMEVSFGKFMSHLKGIRDIEDKVKDRICPFIKDNMIVDSNTQNADNAADDDDSTIDGFRGSILGDCNKYNKDVVSWNMDTLKSGCCGKTCINDN